MSDTRTLALVVDSPATYTHGVATEVRAHAARRNVNQRQLGKALNLGVMAMSRRMRGETPFDVEELAAVAVLLGVRVEDLLPNVQQCVDPVAQVRDRRELASMPTHRYANVRTLHSVRQTPESAAA